MVIAYPHDGETVFAVFAARARRRSIRSLLEQTAACTLAAVLVLLFVPSWWPLSAGLGAAAGYAAWGLLDRRPTSGAARVGLRVLATIATALTLTAAVGIGVAAFTGDAPSPYGACYDANGRAFACDARGQRR